MSDTLAAAIVGGVVGAIIGLLGGIVIAAIGSWTSLRSARLQREHERTMAREERLQDRRARAYEQILEHAYRLLMEVERTEPVVGPKPDPPEPLSDLEYIKLNALVAAHASPEVDALGRELKTATNAVTAAIWRVRDERERPRESEVSAWTELSTARKAFSEALKRLADRINLELSADSDVRVAAAGAGRPPSGIDRDARSPGALAG